jgi:hypothetical protein
VLAEIGSNPGAMNSISQGKAVLIEHPKPPPDASPPAILEGNRRLGITTQIQNECIVIFSTTNHRSTLRETPLKIRPDVDWEPRKSSHK